MWGQRRVAGVVRGLADPDAVWGRDTQGQSSGVVRGSVRAEYPN